MTRRHLNLAANPFVNRRPVTRVTLALAIVAAGFLIADGVLFWRYVRGREDQRELLRHVEGEIVSVRREVTRLERELDGVDLDQDNRRAEFLNRKITERTFGWGLLFDRLAAILPGDVRLVALTPRTLDDRRSPRRGRNAAAAVEELVRLEIQGTARRDEAILELVDALFTDPAFTAPNLSREALEQGQTRFSLTVVYRPAVAAGQPEDAETDDGAVADEGNEPPVPGEARSGAEPATAGADAATTVKAAEERS